MAICRRSASSGSIHRDLKPDNVFLVEQDDYKDHVKIVDFGIALKARAPTSQPGVAPGGGIRQSVPVITKDGKETKDNVRYTMAGMVMGTPHYMSPEQIEGGDIDARSDQYALGCILYEMLTGTVPFDGPEPQAILMNHLASDVQPLRERYPKGKFPSSLQAVVLRMLAKDRSQRYPAMRVAAEELRREAEALRNRTSSTVILPQGKSSGLVIRGRRFSLWSALPVAALLIGGGGYLGIRQFTRSERVEALRGNELREVRQKALTIAAAGLHEPAEEVRITVVEGLGLSRDPRQLPLVLPLLDDPSAAVQAHAATALGQLGNRQAASSLLKVAQKSAAANVRAAAAEAAWQLGDSQGRELLVHALEHGDPAARQKAAFLLAEQGDPKAQEVLRQVLRSGELPEESAIKLLGRLAQSGDQEARAKLRERLADPGRPSYLLAAARLAPLGEEAALQALRTRATSNSPDQLLAVRMLSTVDSEHSLPLLRRMTQDGGASLPARLLAVSGLGQAGELTDLRLLRPLLNDEREPELQRGAALSVLQILARDPGALSEQGLQWARSALSDSDWVVRESAAAVLGDVRAGEALALLEKLAGDSDARVRRSAMRALARLDEQAVASNQEAVLSALRNGLADSDVSVRLEALHSLSRVAAALVHHGASGLATQLADWLATILSEGSPLEQTQARIALLAAGDTSQKAKLRELLQSSSTEARRAALDAIEPDRELLASMLTDQASGVRLLAARRLAELGDKRAVPVLKEALGQGGSTAKTAQALLLRLGEQSAPPIDSGSQDTAEQRLQAVEALASLPAEQAVPLLLAAARDRDLEVRRKVAALAADLPNGGGVPVLRALLEDPNPSVRALAAALLGRLQPAAVAEQPGAARPATTVVAATTQPSEHAPAEPPPSETPPDAGGVAEPPPGETSEAQAAQLTQSGVKLLQRHEFARARQLFEKARRLCGHEKKSGPCGQIMFELSFHLGRAYEAQGYEAEAMTEYEHLIKLGGPAAHSEENQTAMKEAQAGVIRLAPRLGVVRIARQSGGKCQETTKWMPLGVHTVEVDGKKHEVSVSTDAPARVGSCP